MKTLSSESAAMGSFVRIWLIPPHCIHLLRRNRAAGTAFLELKNKADLIEIDHLEEESGYTLKQTDTDAGSALECVFLLLMVACELSDAELRIIEEVTEPTNAFAVVIEDAEGNVYLFGDEENLLSFRDDEKTGPSLARRTRTITGTGILLHRYVKLDVLQIEDLL